MKRLFISAVVICSLQCLVEGQFEFEEHLLTGGFLTTFDANSVYSADLDSDGDIDILSTTQNNSMISWNNRVSWYENDGNQEFTRHLIYEYAYSQYAWKVFAVDFDSDGDVDVFSAATSTYSSVGQKLLFHENDGHGNFTAHGVVGEGVGTKGGRDIYVSDINGDNNLDIIAPVDNNLNWYEYNGDGIFTGHSIANISGCKSVYAKDFDSDNDIDVLACGNNNIILYKNDGTGGFTFVVISESVLDVRSVFGEDMDNDGDTDILCASYGDNKILLFENLGSDVFAEKVISTDSKGANSIHAIDIDNDGDKDVLASSETDSSVVLYLNNGSPEYEKINITTTLHNPQSVFADDVDSDGDSDILFASKWDSKIAWYENLGDNEFISHVVSFNTNGVKTLSTFDVDYDDDIDILVVSEFDNKLSLFENIDGQVFKPKAISIEMEANWKHHLVDFNNDGRLDIFSNFKYDWDGSIGTFGWLENTPSGTFSKHEIPFLGTDHNGEIFPVDLNQDGYIDVINSFGGGGSNSSGIPWYANNSDGTFTRFEIETYEQNCISLLPVDLDDDGDIDILTGLSKTYFTEDDELAWWVNDGEENFTKESIIVGEIPRVLVAIDFDKDGDIDIIPDRVGESLDAFWLENDGNEQFTANKIFSNEELFFESFSVVDFENDGDYDIFAIPSYYFGSIGDLASGQVILLENKGDQTFEYHVIVHEDNEAFTVVAEDIDLDGDIDFAYGSSQMDVVAWYENQLIHNLSNNTDFISFGISGRSVVTEIDPESHIIITEINGEVDLTDLVAVFNISSGATAYINSVPQESGITSNDFTNPVTYSIVAEDGETIQEWVVDIQIGVYSLERKSNSLLIYPNPTNDFVTLEVTNMDQYQLKVTSINGQQILYYDMHGSVNLLDLSNFRKGVYFITILSNEYVTTRKIIKL